MINTPADQFTLIASSKQFKLLRIAAVFLFLVSTALTLAPAAQARSLQVDLDWQHWIGYLVWLVSMAVIVYFLTRYQITTDPILLPVVALLTGWGLLTIWRLAPSLGIKQTIWLFAGSVALVIGLPVTQKALIYLRRYKYIWLTIGLLLTALTLIFGTNPSGFGPRLWLGCCGLYFQPSEPLKILLILYLAAYFADRQPFTRKLLPLLAPTVLVSALAILVLVIQRDLGTASIMIFIYSAMIYVATGKKRLLLISLAGIVIAVILGYSLYDVVQIRLEAWINPWLDPSDRSYQIVQSLIAIASGGMSGRGPGMGYPNVVPISFSDFIFSAVAEEYGLPGTLGLMMAIMLLTFRAFAIGLKAPNRHMQFLAIGLAAYFGSQSVLIIGGNIRLLPLTGVTLPFFSYGGSSLITSLLGLYLLIGIGHAPAQSQVSTRRIQPAFHLAAFLMAGFVAIAMINSWWALWRGPDLLTRTDNPRRTISDRFIQRGKILDRNGVPLSISLGTAGEYYRSYPFAEAAHVIGYTDPFFGQDGAEQSLDAILRGLENQSPLVIWTNHLMYGLPPAGLDARISLDIELQSQAADLIGDAVGAVVLLDANSGEILVMHSSPTYDANQLQENWDALNSDPAAPFFNRALNGRYPPGPSLAPFLLAKTQTSGPLPEGIDQLLASTSQTVLTCTTLIEMPTTWETAAKAGCPYPLTEIGLMLGESGLLNLLAELGFHQSPQIRLDAREAFIPRGLPTPTVTAFGQADVLVSPLQMALAAAALSNQGLRPDPNFLLEAEAHDGRWVDYRLTEPSVQVFSPSASAQTARLLRDNRYPLWETTAYAVTETGQRLTWYLAGSLPDADQADGLFTVAVLLEKADPILAEKVGQQLLLEVISP